MVEPMSDERLAKARAHVARMQEPDADLTMGDYFARDLLAEVERLRANLEQARWCARELEKLRDAYKTERDQARADAKQWHDTYQDTVNGVDGFLGVLLDLMPGAMDEGANAYDQIPRAIEKLKAERDQARAEVERLRAELTRDRESLAHISHEAADLEGFAVDIGVKLKQAEAERDQARADVKALAVEVDQLKAQLETESAAFYLLRDERDHLAKQAADRDGIVSALRVILQRNGMPDGVRQEITDLIGSATGGQS